MCENVNTNGTNYCIACLPPSWQKCKHTSFIAWLLVHFGSTFYWFGATFEDGEDLLDPRSVGKNVLMTWGKSAFIN